MTTARFTVAVAVSFELFLKWLLFHRLPFTRFAAMCALRRAPKHVIKIFINLHSFNGYGLRCPCFLHAHNFRLLHRIYFASHLSLHFGINQQSGEHFQFGLLLFRKYLQICSAKVPSAKRFWNKIYFPSATEPATELNIFRSFCWWFRRSCKN